MNHIIIFLIVWVFLGVLALFADILRDYLAGRPIQLLVKDFFLILFGPYLAVIVTIDIIVSGHGTFLKLWDRLTGKQILFIKSKNEKD